MKMDIGTEVGIPIPGVDYSTSKVTLLVKDVEEEGLDSILEITTNRLADKLSKLNEETIKNIFTDRRYKELVSTIPQSSVEDLQAELTEKYEETLGRAKKEVLRLHKLLEDNNINYKEE